MNAAYVAVLASFGIAALVVTIILGVALLSERLTAWHKAGVVLSLAAIFFLSR